DRGAACVAVDDRGVLDAAVGKPEAVDEARSAVDRDALEAAGERRDVGHMQPAAVDPGRATDRDSYAGGLLEHPRVERLALLGRLRLRVVEPGERAPRALALEGVVVEQDARSNQRARERAAPGLVGPGDEPRPVAAVEAEQARRSARRRGTALALLPLRRGLRGSRFGRGASR